MWKINQNDLLCLRKPEGIKEFVAKLGYKTVQVSRSDVQLTDKVKSLIAGDISELFRYKDKFIFFHIPLNTNKFRRTDLRTIINRFYAHYSQFDFLFFFTCKAPDQIALVCPKSLLKDDKPVFILRTLVLNPEEPYRTDLEILNEIAVEDFPSWERIDEAFNVERVTEKFFQDFKDMLTCVEDELKRLTNYRDTNWANEYALRLLSRIMFLYFLQRKRWLNDNPRFMRDFFAKYQEHREKGANFHRDWLNALFFSAFNKRWDKLNSDEFKKRFPPEILQALQNAPYLNGGLFLEDKLDRQAKEYSAFLPDEIFEELIYRDNEPGFFEHYNFTVAENTPLDQEVAVDPEMIGKVYESLVHYGTEEGKEARREGRRAGGIFYTPRVEIDLMCRLSLVDYLSNNLDIPKDLLYRWVFAFSEEEKESVDSQLRGDYPQRLWEILRDIRVLDPACGSGSFLVGMLLVLDDLLQRLEKRLGKARSPYERRKEIIQNSLYGVDIMSWAVRVAELRLWLQLIIETEITEINPFLSPEPLLPNLSFKIRQGDSLIQKIGGYVFHPKSLPLGKVSLEIKKEIEAIKREKRELYHKPSPGYEERIKSKERNLLLKLIRERKIFLQKEIQERYQLLKAPKLYPHRESANNQKILNEIEELERELEELNSAAEEMSKREEEELPFIWDVAFPEAFDEGGFDIVIGNPPYIRQEKINDLLQLPGTPIYARVIWDYKQELMNGLRHIYPYFLKERNLDAQSDLYIYFYLYCLSLLKEKGSFCFITSSSWLDVDFGKVLQEFLLRHSHIKMIIDNSAKRSFSQASINTVIVLLSPPSEKARQERKLARFIQFKVPFEEVLAQKLGEVRAVPFLEIEETEKGIERAEFVCRVRKQGDLLEEGMDERGEYEGQKWGGIYLRAPDIFWKVLEKAGEKMAKLSAIGEVKFAIKTGANEFFYLEEIGREGGLVYVRNKAGWEGPIEEECLRPFVKSLKELRSIKGNRDFQYQVFFVNEPPDRLRKSYPNAYRYVKWGEEKGYQNRPTCKQRKYWYIVGDKPPGDIILSVSYGDRYLFLLNEGYILDHTLYNLYFKKIPPEDRITFLLFLNSSLFPLFTETRGRTYGGGVLGLMVYEFERISVLSPLRLSSAEKRAFVDFYARREDFLLRPIKSICEELGFPKQGSDYKNIDVEAFSLDKVMPDRRELDEIIFSILGLNEEEKIEVYKAVIQLVKNRLTKAKSV